MSRLAGSLVAAGVSKSYGAEVVLADVSLVVPPCARIGLVGPNGAGKSTLLRACAGLVPVVDGEAAVLGHDLRADRRAVRRSVGLLGPGGILTLSPEALRRSPKPQIPAKRGTYKPRPPKLAAVRVRPLSAVMENSGAESPASITRS